MAAPVNEHPDPPDGSSEPERLWSPAWSRGEKLQQSIEKSSAHRRWAESEGLPAVEQVPGGTQLGHTRAARPRQFRDGQGLPLVARDMEPDGMLGRKGPIAS